jgi:hypothetical protein
MGADKSALGTIGGGYDGADKSALGAINRPLQVSGVVCYMPELSCYIFSD